VAGSPDSGVGIWNLDDGARLARLTGVPWGYELSWSPAGNLVAADVGSTVQLWNVSHPRRPMLVTHVPIPSPTLVVYLLFSPDGQRLAIVSDDPGRVSMFDVNADRILWTRTTTDVALRQVAYSPDGGTIAINSGDSGRGQMALLDPANGNRRRWTALQSYGGVGYLQHGRWLVVTGNQARPQAQLYDTATLQPIGIHFLPRTRSAIRSQSMTPGPCSPKQKAMTHSRGTSTRMPGRRSPAISPAATSAKPNGTNTCLTGPTAPHAPSGRPERSQRRTTSARLSDSRRPRAASQSTGLTRIEPSAAWDLVQRPCPLAATDLIP
jgi:WD40 repeat protein